MQMVTPVGQEARWGLLALVAGRWPKWPKWPEVSRKAGGEQGGRHSHGTGIGTRKVLIEHQIPLCAGARLGRKTKKWGTNCDYTFPRSYEPRKNFSTLWYSKNTLYKNVLYSYNYIFFLKSLYTDQMTPPLLQMKTKTRRTPDLDVLQPQSSLLHWFSCTDS